MAKKADGPFIAVAVEIPEDAPAHCPPGTEGVLEVWESERKWPGKRGALFFFRPFQYFKTRLSYDLTIDEGGVASFEKEGRCYRFKIKETVGEKAAERIDAIVAEQLKTKE